MILDNIPLTASYNETAWWGGTEWFILEIKKYFLEIQVKAVIPCTADDIKIAY